MILTQKRAHLTREDAVTVAMIEAAVPVLAATRHLLERFQVMVRTRDPSGLDAWLDDARDYTWFYRDRNADIRLVIIPLSPFVEFIFHRP